MLDEIVGSYKITARIASGGMGVVYRAEHSLIGKNAAVKLLREEVSRKRTVIDRFFNEAKATIPINHPGIIEIFDYGYHSDGRAYIIMELLEGETLKKRIRRRGIFPANEAVPLVRLVAGAVGAAHANGVVHRDLKPDNIFLVPDPDIPGGERIKVLDFGLAKLFDNDSTGHQTRTGAVMGTPTYMAPEQCKGAGTVDHRADIYSLGCILYEMLCGKPPFVADGVGEIIGSHLYKPVPPPHLFNQAMNSGLEAVILRMLAKSPDVRFQHMNELRAALEGEFPDRGDTTGTTAELPMSELFRDRPDTSPGDADEPPTTEAPSPMMIANAVDSRPMSSSSSSNQAAARLPLQATDPLSVIADPGAPSGSAPGSAPSHDGFPPPEQPSTLGGSAAQVMRYPMADPHDSQRRVSGSSPVLPSNLSGSMPRLTGRSSLRWIVGGVAGVLFGVLLALVAVRGSDDERAHNQAVAGTQTDPGDRAVTPDPTDEPTENPTDEPTENPTDEPTEPDDPIERDDGADPESASSDDPPADDPADDPPADDPPADDPPGDDLSADDPPADDPPADDPPADKVASAKDDKPKPAPKKRARLYLAIKPSSAKATVKIDGSVKRARSVTLTRSRSYRVQVTAPGFEAYHRRVRMNGDRTLTIQLKRKQPSLPIDTKI